MSSSTRLRVSLIVIVLSAFYGIIIVHDPNLASAISSGYVAMVLTAVLLLNLWKKP